MTTAEFKALLADPSKRIDEDISWDEDKSLLHVVSFRVRVKSDSGYHLIVKGSHNREIGKTSYTLFTGDLGRIFSVDYDRRHGTAGKFHIHQWDGERQTCVAIAADADAEVGKDPERLWAWFCERARITHSGVLGGLPPKQGEMFS